MPWLGLGTYGVGVDVQVHTHGILDLASGSQRHPDPCCIQAHCDCQVTLKPLNSKFMVLIIRILLLKVLY